MVLPLSALKSALPHVLTMKIEFHQVTDGRLPNEDVIILCEAWPCDSPMLSPLIMFTVGHVWTVSSLLEDF